jgi:hypothetical protein
MTLDAVDRMFEQEEATATLPLVRRIVDDIRNDGQDLEAVLPLLKEARIRARRERAPSPNLAELRERVAEITTRFEGYLAELAQIGCVYRGTSGHVDFRAEDNGQPVFLCWSPEEETVEFAHSLGLDCRHRARIEVPAVLPLVGS